ncbi:hypothetical protein, partial [Elizabethkingia meningoseptica]|uniref:hypothetical protein n=1 Tax=Elizabethkingia meningoseptica TaxID=238 RepID=UPI0031584AA1
RLALRPMLKLAKMTLELQRSRSRHRNRALENSDYTYITANPRSANPSDAMSEERQDPGTWNPAARASL